MTQSLAGLLVALALAFPGVVAAQQVYKWVDRQGVTHYSSTPPSGRAFQLVDAAPTNYVHVIAGAKQRDSQQSERLKGEAAQDATKERAPARHPVPLPAGATIQQLANEQTAALQRAATPRARGMSLDTFRQLEAGMPEGEVLVRAGPPDYESNQFLSSGYLGKTWYYLPTPSDPFTTVVQISGGLVFSLDRVRQF